MMDDFRFKGSDADYKARALGVEEPPKPESLRIHTVADERIRTIAYALDALERALRENGKECTLDGVILSDEAFRMIEIDLAASALYKDPLAPVPAGELNFLKLTGIPLYRVSKMKHGT